MPDPAPLSLTVAEAAPRDVGRGIARLDPADLAELGVQAGDLVLLGGARATPARVQPAFGPDTTRGTVQIDGIVRSNAQVGLGEQVSVAPTTAEPAIAVTFAPTSAAESFAREDAVRYLARVFTGLPLTRGDRVRASLFGSSFQEFSVVETSPAGPVLVGPNTRVRVRTGARAGREPAGVTYEDVGALRREVHRIREMVELPLRHPELFERLGIEPPRGLLLHGPPGTGKTLIARAVAGETDAAFFALGGPEVIHKFYGESEAHLRAVFEEAGNQAPSIIFIDEIDAIATRRQESRGDQQLERRVVAQLLALMDGLKTRGQVVVIGATNLPGLLDPALRRPGRFDRELAIGVPDRAGRLEILQIHSRGMPLAEDVSLDQLAGLTHGYVGADLESLCREAAMVTLRKLAPSIRWTGEGLPYDLVAGLRVAMADFLEALSEIEPSAIREVFTELPDVGWEDVGGLDEARQALVEAIEWPLKYPAIFRRAGTVAPRGILLTGRPGTGKTLLAQAVASRSGLNFINVKGSSVLSKWVGESEQRLGEVFKKARQTAPCILFFDELDSLAPARGGRGDGGAVDRLVGQLLAEIDGVESQPGVTILAASNRPDAIDPALLRAGRFEMRLELPPPDRAARRQILAVHARGRPLGADVDLDDLAAQTEGLVGADLAALCRRASVLAIRAALAGRSEPAFDPETAAVELTATHFAAALAGLRG